MDDGAAPGRGGPRRLEVHPVRATDSAVDVIRHALAVGVTRLIAAEPVARAGTDPEGVHQARVSARRVRSDLATFRPLLDREWTRALRAELTWLGSELGAVRDTDVLRIHLEAAADNLDERDRKALVGLLATLDDQWASARAALDVAFASPRYRALRDDLVAAAQVPVVTSAALAPAAKVMPRLVRKACKRLDAAVAALPPDASDEQLHDVRILAKRARYASEAVQDAFGKPARRFAKAMGTVQDTLGAYNDAAVAQQWLRAHTVAPDATHLGVPADTAFAAGVLSARFDADAQHARDAFAAVWQRAAAPSLRKWL